jgi:hypothetical protein
LTQWLRYRSRPESHAVDVSLQAIEHSGRRPRPGSYWVRDTDSPARSGA